MANATPVVLGTAIRADGSVAVLAGNQVSTYVSGITYTAFDQLQVAILPDTTPVSLDQSAGLAFPAGMSPNQQFNPSGGGAITADGNGVAVLTWGNSDKTYDIQVLDGAGSVTTTPTAIANTGLGDAGYNAFGLLGSWSGGLVAGMAQNNLSNYLYERLDAAGSVTSTVAVSPGSGPFIPSLGQTTTYTLGSMAVDSLGDVIFGFSASNVYANGHYLEYNASNTLIAAGDIAGTENAPVFAALAGGGFVTATYAPNSGWNPATGYSGFNLVIQEVSSAGVLSTLHTLAGAYGQGSGASVSDTAVTSAGLMYFRESGQSAFTSYNIGTDTLTRTAYTPATAGLAFAAAPGTNTTFGVSGAAVTVSNQVVSESLACFAGGTRIATPDGPMAVEVLRSGDVVSLARGGSAEVVWIGHRVVDCVSHPQPERVWPVRVRAGAFGPGIPTTDLLISPDHAVFMHGVLIPIHRLVNGATVLREPTARVSYWHVELAQHDVLLAEGLPTESYLDTGNRDAFANGGQVVRAHPDFGRMAWERHGCAPLVLEGPRRDAVHRRLLARSAAAGWSVTADADPVLEACGRSIPPVTQGDWLHFLLPDGASECVLRSRSFVPAELCCSDDTRRLGVAIAALECDGTPVPLDGAALSAGWHRAESDWRWTDGAGHIQVAGARSLRVRIVLGGPYRRPPRDMLKAATCLAA